MQLPPVRLVRRSQVPAFAPPSVPAKRLPSTFRAPSEVVFKQLGGESSEFASARWRTKAPSVHLPCAFSAFRAPSVHLRCPFAIRAPVLVDPGDNSSEAR